MIDVSKKNEKFMVNRNKEKLKAQNESRGESPVRKDSFPAKNTSAVQHQPRLVITARSCRSCRVTAR